MENIRKKIKNLNDKLNHYDKFYHSEDDPLISDQEYDDLLKDYEKLIQKYPNLGFKKRENVGFKPKDIFSKIEHKKPMLSLNNGFTISDIQDFIIRIHKFLNIHNEQVELVCEPKIDGLSISLVYDNGEFKSAITRGDGLVGETVTNNVITIEDIPKNIKNAPKYIEIRGEIFMLKTDFLILNKDQKQNSYKLFSNPRNAAAGTIRQKEIEVVKNRKLKFSAYTIGETSDEFKFYSQFELLKIFNDWGFKVPEHIKIVKDIHEIKDYYDFILKKREDLNYEIDGIVYKVNSFELQNRLGNLSRAPRWAIAHKLPSKTVQTVIKSIDLQVGRTGAITPVARVKKTNVGGVNISNISLHNEDEIKRKDIRVGDTVIIERAGDVIPNVVKVLHDKRNNFSKPYVIPKYCPECKSLTSKPENEARRRCLNHYKCNAQVIEKLIHFCSKNALNINGLGEKQIKVFYNSNFIFKFSDIFSLKKHKSELLELNRFGKLSIKNILNSIEKSKKISFEKFLYALGIKQIGLNTARLLAEHFISVENLNNQMINYKGNNYYNDIININNIGTSIVNDFVSYFQIRDNLHEFQILSQILDITEYSSEKVISFLSDKKIVITGSFDTLSRDELKNKITVLGGKVMTSVSANTDYLICGKNPGSKLQLATQKNINILNEEEILKLM